MAVRNQSEKTIDNNPLQRRKAIPGGNWNI